MGMVSRLEITERFGDPASFAYFGQYYHSLTPAKCALCGRDIRNVYTLRPPRGRSVRSGECCFAVFKKYNTEVYTRLLAARIMLDSSDEGLKNDTKVFNIKGDLDYRVREWRRLRRQVLTRVREYRKANNGSDWLPKTLHELKAEVERRPGKTIVWFDRHIPILRDKIATEIPSL